MIFNGKIIISMKKYIKPQTELSEIKIQPMLQVPSAPPKATDSDPVANPTYDMDAKYRNNGAWNSLW